MKRSSYYEILGLHVDATEAEIRSAYLRLSRQHHPDTGGDRARFEEVRRAYEVLSDPERRRTYDLEQEFKPLLDTGMRLGRRALGELEREAEGIAVAGVKALARGIRRRLKL